MTKQYNEALKTYLPDSGIELWEIPRLETAQAPISASAVRAALDNGNKEALKSLLPETTLTYLNLQI